MVMLEIEIPGFGSLKLEYLVSDLMELCLWTATSAQAERKTEFSNRIFENFRFDF